VPNELSWTGTGLPSISIDMATCPKASDVPSPSVATLVRMAHSAVRDRIRSVGVATFMCSRSRS
jgi:hypothetical protein